MANIVIAGASGFIGVNLLRRIHHDPAFEHFEQLVLVDPLQYGVQKIPSRILADERVRFERISIYAPGVAARLIGAGDLVIHSAAEVNTADSPQDGVGDDPIGYLRALSDAGIGRLLFMSSADVYGINDSDDLRETDPVSPTTIYAAAKAAFEAYLSAFHASEGLPVVVFRPVTIYGPDQYPGWLVPVVITRALAGRRVTLLGDGSARRDWIHVDDVCELLAAASLTDRDNVHGEVFNIGTGTEDTVLGLTRYILDTIDHPDCGLDLAPARPADPRRQVTTAAKARDTFGWAPRIGLREGLDRTIAAYRQPASSEV
ncbi:NAD-dependent epimerase/dehydratase family protein [Nocardia amamiensis]|uniref:NAD-dependent epimerase/dehydratase family protein n=1 Tax=Nocardia amamiensis TaxID=404578 RepID=A0ABS0D013_9NOCA|nr:NAD-dependent epimerase/dehydratase family protein [Nocardia amamiensis]MBF6300418.1 NAD-dependent epimerase/dehydratase family protein [Nocardia amamiensis]